MFDSYGTRGSTDNSTDPYSGYGSENGYYTDSETGLQLCTSRFYDSNTGRFINRDPSGYSGGLNLYGYADSNPIMESDPSGLSAVGYAVTGTTIVVIGMAMGCGIAMPLVAAGGILTLAWLLEADVNGCVTQEMEGEYAITEVFNAFALAAGPIEDLAGGLGGMTGGGPETPGWEPPSISNEPTAPGESSPNDSEDAPAAPEAAQTSGPTSTSPYQDYLDGSGGRWGSHETRAQNVSVIDDYPDWTLVRGGMTDNGEEYIPGPTGGTAGSAYPDLTFTKDGQTLRVNTVDTNADGDPTTRELANAQRIQDAFPNDHLILIPKR